MFFYTFRQNNSGGFWTGPAKYVIVEAKNLKWAMLIAEENGVYFNGCNSGQDCSCCGDRWSEPWENDTTDKPMIYGEEPIALLEYASVGHDCLIIRDGDKKEYLAVVEKGKVQITNV